LKRSDLIACIERENPDLSSPELGQIVDLFFDRIAHALASGGRVELRGFGSFSTRSYDARTARNPKSGVQVEVIEKRRPFFRPGSSLAKRLR
jgi:integration host factor subunit beta